MPEVLQSLLYIDFREESQFEESYKRLLAVVRNEPLPEPSHQDAPHISSFSTYVPHPPAMGFVARRDRDGRDIIEQLREELAPGSNRLVALWGAGGVGKTTLAAEVARVLAENFAYRVIWVSADARTDVTLSTLLDEIGVQLVMTRSAVYYPSRNWKQSFQSLPSRPH